MALKNHLSNKLWSLFLILCITRVCHGQLMCYVCENCSKVNAQTPLLECNEDFFNPSGTTDSSVQTTPENKHTTEGITEDGASMKPTGTVTEESTTTTTTTTTTTEMPTTTTTTETTEADTTSETATDTTKESTTETSTEMTTEETTVKATSTTSTTTTTLRTTTENETTSEEAETTMKVTEPTEQQPPTPPTVGPPITTTSVPTPPNLGALTPIDDVEVLNNRKESQNKDVAEDVDGIEIIQPSAKAYKPSAEFRVRQLRAVSDVTYHCFKVQATNVNGTMVINRGCSRVQTMESVCGKWVNEHPTEKMNKCDPCTRSQCNGSTALNVSITAVLVALVAVVMHRM